MEFDARVGVNSIVDGSGGPVALSADSAVLAVGAVGNDDAGNQAGHVRVFAWDAAAAAWAQRGADIDGEAVDDRSGMSVAISVGGAVLAVGALWNDGAGNQAGCVRVFAWDEAAADDGVAADNGPGESVALSSDGAVLAVRAPLPLNGGAGQAAGAGNRKRD